MDGVKEKVVQNMAELANSTSESIKKVTENEDVKKVFDTANREYGKLLKKQKGHIVEWLTFAIATVILGIFFKSFRPVTTIVLLITIYLVLSRNRMIELQNEIEKCASALKTTEAQYNRGMREVTVLKKKISGIEANADLEVIKGWQKDGPLSINQITSPHEQSFSLAFDKLTINAKRMLEIKESFNNKVNEYNNYVTCFPSNFAALIWGFEAAKFIGANLDKDVTIIKEEREINTDEFDEF